MKKIIFILGGLLTFNAFVFSFTMNANGNGNFAVGGNVNMCYLPLLWVTGGVNFNNWWQVSWGLTFDCNNIENKIWDFCNKFDNYFGWDDWVFGMNFSMNVYKFLTEFNFMFNLPNYSSLKYFYFTYCADNNYKRKVSICYNDSTYSVPYYEVFKWLNKWAIIWACNAGLSQPKSVKEETKKTNSVSKKYKLPSYLRIDRENSVLIFNFAKNYHIVR